MGTKMATALKKGNDSAATATVAIREALEKLGTQAHLAICYCSPKYDYQAVVDVIRRETGGAPLVGCSSAGEFTESEVASESIAVAVIASDTHRFHTAWADGLEEDPDRCVQAALAKLPAEVEGHPYRSFLLYHDGLVGKGEEAVVAAMLHLGAGARFSGGSAGDDLAFEKSYVFCDDQVARDAVALCLWSSKVPLPISVKHGHQPASPVLAVTKAEGSVLYEVDGRNAWEVWKEHTRDAAAKVGIDVDALDNPTDVGAFLIRYELGLLTGEEYKVRVPLSKNEDGSLNFACTIFPGSKFRIMESFKEKQIEAAAIAAKQAVSDPIAADRAGVLVFDCVCRGIILGDEFGQGVAAIRQQVGDVPMIGFETYGEICMREGEFSGYHNTTTVVTVIPT